MVELLIEMNEKNKIKFLFEIEFAYANYLSICKMLISL